MTPDKELALGVLRHLMQGATIGGVRFGAIPQLLIDNSPPEVRGQVYVNLESRWASLPELPRSEPQREEELPDFEMEEATRQLCFVREQVIERVDLGADSPHLVLTL